VGGRTETWLCFAALTETKVTSILANMSQTELNVSILVALGPLLLQQFILMTLTLTLDLGLYEMSSEIQRFVLK
jgi:hypothetical protein